MEKETFGFRVVTFNTLGYSHDCYQDTDLRKTAIMSALESNELDVVLLQELKTVRKTMLGDRHRSEEFLCESSCFPNSRLAFGDQRAESKEAVGILSKYPYVEERFGLMPKAILNRAYVLVRVDFGSGLQCYFLTFHLAAPAMGRMITKYGATYEIQELRRKAQLDFLSGIVNELDSRLPVIVGGDFNVESGVEIYENWKELSQLTEIWPDSELTPRKTFATHPSDSFDVGLELRLDHLLYRNGSDVKLEIKDEGPMFQQKVADSNKYFYGFLSDHIGVFADVELTRVSSEKVSS